MQNAGQLLSVQKPGCHVEIPKPQSKPDLLPTSATHSKSGSLRERRTKQRDGLHTQTQVVVSGLKQVDGGFDKRLSVGKDFP